MDNPPGTTGAAETKTTPVIPSPPLMHLKQLGWFAVQDASSWLSTGVLWWVFFLLPFFGQDSVTHVEVLPPAKELKLPLQNQTRGKKVHQWSRKKGKRNLITRQPGKEQQISKMLNSQSAEIMVTIEKECGRQLPNEISAQPQKLCRASVLWLLLTTTVAVLVWLLCWSSFLALSQPPCLQANGLAKSFHLMLSYAGPPPT